VTIFYAGIDIVNGISSNLPPTSCCVDLGSRTLIDFKFLNDESLIVLCTQGTSSHFLPSTPTQPPISNPFHSLDNVPSVLWVPIQRDRLPYGTYDPADPTGTTQVVSADPFELYSFPDTPVLRPVRMDVCDKSNVRGEVPARICLLESNCTTLRTFALPSTGA
jgi:anaphase-promoting complex subunit 4